MNADPVVNYYENIAGSYDESRFGNSYGKFIHAQEMNILRAELPSSGKKQVLDLACGTGRFMEFADTGVDVSEAMLEVASKKWPDKMFHHADADSLPFPDACFDSVICMHLCMHLTPEKVAQIVAEIRRVLKPGGSLIIDFPSRKRRHLLRHSQAGWHGANSYTKKDIADLFIEGWTAPVLKGILFLPVHRFPIRWRPWFSGLDHVLTRSFLREYSSYLVAVVSRT